MKRFLICAIAALSAFGLSAQQKMTWDEAYQKADELISKLTLEEKIGMTRGFSKFFINGSPEKGMPYMYLSDASGGVHLRPNLPASHTLEQLEKSVAFPAPIMLAATFNDALAEAYGRAVGEECRAGGVEVLLGPGVNIYRTSRCGRNFEYMGEDPLLTSVITSEYIKGMQSTGTAACVKHFVANNTEFYRKRSNSIVDERALYEIYMPAFQAAVDAGVAFIMTSYNQLNGEWAGQSEFVIKDLIRGHLGFCGGVMSDWDSIFSLENMLKSGQNLEMPGMDWKEGIPELMAQGKFSEEDLNVMIRPIVATCVAFGLYDRPKYDKSLAKYEEHEQVAYNVAAEGTVLLENNGILPLDRAGKTILLTGKFLNEPPRGRGSAYVEGYDFVGLPAAVKAEFGDDVIVVPVADDQQIKSADVVLLSVGTIDSEARERPFALPAGEEAYIRKVVEANPNTVVIVNSGSGIRMTDWAGKAAAVIYNWYPGQNGLRALADVLSGDLNPSGKLPMTIEKDFADSPAVNSYPADVELPSETGYVYWSDVIYDVKYEESVLVGYRWYETKGIEPLYPFGYGLSYTDFSLDKVKLSSSRMKDGKTLTVKVKVTNTGERAGSEVVQVYVSEKKPTVLRPKKELKAFKKVNLRAGESAVVELELDTQDLAFWNDEIHSWDANRGEYVISVGTSSADIACTRTVKY